MKIHKFESSMDAYDACQCDPNITNGDTLVIEDEKIVALAWTWPVAVTEEHGQLHIIAEEGNLDSLMKDAEWTEDQVRDAIWHAVSNDWLLSPKFLEFGTRPVVITNIRLKFPAGVSQERADEITLQVKEGINNDLETAGSDMWPGEVPVLEMGVKKS